MIYSAQCVLKSTWMYHVGGKKELMVNKLLNWSCASYEPNFNPNSLDNKGSRRILKDFYCSVTLLRELIGLMVLP